MLRPTYHVKSMALDVKLPVKSIKVKSMQKYIKVGCKGVYMTWTCLHDECCNIYIFWSFLTV